MESQEGLAVVAEKQLPMTHQDGDRLRRQNNVRCQDEQNIDKILIGIALEGCTLNGPSP